MMKLIQISFAVAVVAVMTGCASTKAYFGDRGRDAADIFTVTGGFGLGAGVRAGPVHCGLLSHLDCIGLRGGELLPMSLWREGLGSWGEPLLFIPTGDGPYCGSDEFKTSPLVQDPRGKGYRAVPYCPVPPVSWLTMLPSAGTGSSVPRGQLPRRGTYPWQYLTQVDVAVGLGVSTRLGFNPGELLDFILGWTTIDIYKDDMETQKTRGKSNQASEVTARKLTEPQG